MNKKITIIGPFNTGTNLMQKVITSSFVDKDSNIKISLIPNDKIIWKHSIDLEKLKILCETPNLYIIVMYRNLYSWINSMFKAKYDLKFSRIDDPVVFRGADKSVRQYKNIIDVFNTWYTNYKKLLEKYENIVFLDYIKVVDKVNGFKYINQKIDRFNMRLYNEELYFNCLEKPAKFHGKPVKNSQEASEKYELDKNKIKNEIMKYKNLREEINYDLINYYEK